MEARSQGILSRSRERVLWARARTDSARRMALSMECSTSRRSVSDRRSSSRRTRSVTSWAIAIRRPGVAVIHHLEHDLEVSPFAGLVPDADVERGGLPGLRHPPIRLGQHGLVVGMCEGPERERVQLSLGVAGHGERRRRRVQPVTVGVVDGDEVGGSFHHEPEPAIGLAGERLLEQGWTGEDLSEYVRTEMQSLLLDDPRLSADHLAKLLAAQGATLPEGA